VVNRLQAALDAMDVALASLRWEHTALAEGNARLAGRLDRAPAPHRQLSRACVALSPPVRSTTRRPREHRGRRVLCGGAPVCARRGADGQGLLKGPLEKTKTGTRQEGQRRNLAGAEEDGVGDDDAGHLGSTPLAAGNGEDERTHGLTGAAGRSCSL
jgi:hypothetical protein